jgi:hypothetical protein
MSLAVFKDNHFTLMGTKYFVANAQTVSVGSYGQKATPVFGQNKLEVKDHIPAPKLDGKIKQVAPALLDSVSSKKSDFTSAVGATLKVFGFNGSVSTIYDELAKNHLKFVQFWMEENSIKDAANGSPKVLDDLRLYGGSARIAHQLIVIMEASWATSFTGATNYDFSADAAGIISIQASGGAAVSGKDHITLSAGTGIAYLLLKLDWANGKNSIVNTHVDEWSLN